MWSKVNQRIGQALQNIRQAFRAVTSATDSDKKVQFLQLKGLAGENLDGSEYFQHYGYTSNPPAGSMAIAVPMNGQTSHTIIVATEHGTYRMKALKSGEVAIYTDEGAYIHLKRDRIIEVECDEYRVHCKKYVVDADDSVTYSTKQHSVSASTASDFTTPELTASQQVIAEGKISGHGGMSIRGGDGSGSDTAVFEGNVRQINGSYNTDGDVKAGTISVRGHRHTNGNDGSPTGDPIP